MANGIWPAVSGAEAQSLAVDIVSNNLANMNTQGFKKDQPLFREYLTILERDNGVPDIPRGPITDDEFYRLDGKDQSFVITDGTTTNFRQGALRVTNRPLDLAIEGDGFFEVSTPYGVRYTKQGSFGLAKDGQLVTAEGYPVLAAQPGGLANAQPASAVQPSQGGQLTQGGVTAGQFSPSGQNEVPLDPTTTARFINLSDLGPNISVTKQGAIYAGDSKVGDLSVVHFQDLKKLRKTGNQTFLNPDPQNLASDPAKRADVLQGVIETSNVNPVEEMTNLIKANRMFESNLKAIRTYDQMMSKESNELGKL